MKEKRKYRYSSDEEGSKKKSRDEGEKDEDSNEQAENTLKVIRHKTVVKLEKMMRKTGLEDGAKDISI